MSAVLGWRVSGEGWLFRLDPRPKLAYAALGIVLCLIARQSGMLAILLAVAHVILLAGGVPIRVVALAWRRLGFLVAIILVGQTLLFPGDSAALFQFGPIRVTEAGFQVGLRYALRVASASLIAITPLFATPIQSLTRGLEKVGFPYAWSMTVGLALRYLGTIGGLYQTISEAQQARGWDAPSGHVLKRARAAAPTLVAVIIASLRLSDSLTLGMAARGYGLKRPRTRRQDIAMRGHDWIALAAMCAGFAAGLAASLALA